MDILCWNIDTNTGGYRLGPYINLYTSTDYYKVIYNIIDNPTCASKFRIKTGNLFEKNYFNKM